METGKRMRKARNLRYSMRKKGYYFKRGECVAVMPEDYRQRSRLQERRLAALEYTIQYNMFNFKKEQS